MKRLKQLLKKLLQHDKLKHFFGGFFLFAAFDYFYEPWIALCCTAIIAVGTEVIYDGMLKKGTPEFLDIVYGVAAGVVITFFL